MLDPVAAGRAQAKRPAFSLMYIRWNRKVSINYITSANKVYYQNFSTIIAAAFGLVAVNLGFKGENNMKLSKP